VVHITVNANHGCWDLESKTEDMKWINCLVEGIKKADAYVDFSSFDKNNDGEITTDEMALAVVVAGYEAAFDSGFSQGKNYYLWSHAWNIYSGWYSYFRSQYPDWEDFLPCPDGVYVDNYIAIAEQLQKNRQEPISVLAHELGHYLGLPDLYDTDYGSGAWSTYDVSDLSVMCSGSWGWNNIINDYMPVAFDAWSRCCLGWVAPETISCGVYDVASDKGDEYNVLRVETGVSGEYYLLENREISGWDQGLYNTYHSYASNGGLVCWHIDDAVYDTYADSNAVNNSGHRPAVMPLYPEKKNNKITFIGTLDSDGLKRPFFTYDIWNSYYAGTLDCVDFPRYNGSNSYSGRTFSGVKMNIRQAPNSHSVRVDFIHSLTATPANAATCTEAGNSAYWTCSLCGKYFSDADGNNEIAENSWVIAPLGHNLNPMIAHDATCTEAGNTAYWKCMRCGKGFSDAQGNNEIAQNSWVIPALGHDWDEGVITIEPTCLDGLRTLTCKRCGETTTETIPANLGHDWDTENVVFNWHSLISAEAVFTCKRDSSHTATVQATITTEFGDGITTYTATAVFEGETYTDEKSFEYVVPEHLRIKGSNRYETALQAASHLRQRNMGAKLDTVIVASGEGFADALSGSYLAHVAKAPILLVSTSYEQKVFDYIKENVADGAKIYILGGNNAVSENFESLLIGYDVERIGGYDRYETNLMILDIANSLSGDVLKDTILVCSGRNFADALSTSFVGRPILLVDDKPQVIHRQYFWELKSILDHVYIIGGTKAVSESVESEIADVISPNIIQRLGGANRYETCYMVNETFGDKSLTAVLVYGRNFPDGLSGGAVASAIGAPVLLVENDENAIRFAAKGVTLKQACYSITLGGPQLISDDTIRKVMNKPDAEIVLFE
ncbi:MAG: cell wall-binding repeat-containing protein, partial [Firmicutes bacterium]|nr:cell wall-binding repeat-containing protein [Bacillota bacterium]MBQ2305469.1 cell wall-binding repeat-containing protein [Bacillota bacterium]